MTAKGLLNVCACVSCFIYSNAPIAFSSKVCYIKYREPSSVGVAQHLTNTVLIDRALIVVPCAEGECGSSFASTLCHKIGSK